MQQKQKLLRQEILDKGYDPSKFYQYWQSLNLDFEQVQFEQLKIIVQTYVQTFFKHQQQNQDDQFDQFQAAQLNQNQIQVKNNIFQNNNQKDIYADFDWDLLMGKSSNIKKQQSISIKKQIKKLPKQFDKKVNDMSKGEIIQKQKNPIKKQLNLIQDFDVSLVGNDSNKQKVQLAQNTVELQKSIAINFKEIQTGLKKQKIKCLKLQQNILNHHKNVQITITNVQQVIEQGSLMNKLWKGKDYLYTIKTIGRNKNRSIGVSWQVKKKYSDFQWLRNVLIKFYPAIIVPPLPGFPKNKQKINSQKYKLQNFLMDSYRCPQLRNSKYFQVFLSYGNFSDFQGFKKSTQNILKPKQPANIINMKGQVQLYFGPNIQIYSNGIGQYLNKSSQHLRNVKMILAQIQNYYDNISYSYTKLSHVFQQMSKQSCQFSEQKCFPKLTQTYQQISSLIQKHSKFCIQEKDNIQNYLISHFSYEKDRIDNMQELISKRNQFATQFSKRQPKSQSTGMFGKLTGGVSSLFGQKSQSFDIPSSNYEKLSKQVGFFNSQLLNQTIRCVQGMIQSQIDHFSAYGISRIDSVDKLQKTWSQIMVQLSKLSV